MEKHETLDDQFDEKRENLNKKTQSIVLKTIIYFIIMLSFDFVLVYFKYNKISVEPDLLLYTTTVIIGIGTCIVISSILELFRFTRRKRKKKQLDTAILTDPFWFQVIEGAFALWILFTVVNIIMLVLA